MAKHRLVEVEGVEADVVEPGPVAVYAKAVVGFLGILGLLLLSLVGIPGVPEQVNGWLSVAAGAVTVVSIVLTKNADTVDNLIVAGRKLGLSVVKKS